MMSIVRVVPALSLFLFFGGDLFAQAAASTPLPTDLVANETIAAVRLLDRPAKLSIDDVPLFTGLTDLQDHSGVSLVYSPSKLPRDQRVSCQCYGLTVGDALDQLLLGTGMRYSVVEPHVLIEPTSLPQPQVTGHVRLAGMTGLRGVEAGRSAKVPLLLLKNPGLAQQTGTITGQVVEAVTQQPLAGVQVSIPESGIGTLTDNEGNFLLVNVPAGQVEVRAQLIGYGAEQNTVSVVDGESVTVNFELEEAPLELDEVVVTGTAGATRRRAIGNTVAQIDAAEVMDVAPVRTVQDLITSRTPGVLIRPAAGTAGAGGRIKIRGTSSLTLDTQPLIYVDGIRVDNSVGSGPDIQGGRVTSRFNDINPDNIESIEIIKGPAAATLYGTEAASGVIQIITKKGRPDQLDIGLTVRQGATWFPNPENRFPVNWYQGEETNGELESLNVVESEKARGTPIYRAGHLQSYGLNISGGADKVRYYIAGDFDSDEGVERTNVVQRMNGRANITVIPHSSVDITTSLGLTQVDADLVREDSPTQSVTGATLRASPRLLDTPSRGFYAVPPEVIWDVFDLKQEIDRFIASVQVNHRPTGWLTQRVTLGGDFLHENNSVLVTNLPPEQAQFFSENFASGFKDINRRDVTNTTVDYGATATLPLREGISSATSFGLQYYRKFFQFQTAHGEQFPAPGVKTVNAAAVAFGGDDYLENITVGSYLQQQFTVNDRLFLTAAVRADDNSAFGADFDVQIYPKLSASWVISEEPFWNFGIVDALRLRAAYGQSGQQPDAFAAIRTFDPVTGTGDRPAASPQSLGNTELGPERGEEVELGFETSLLQNRLTLDFTFYNQLTRDAILLAPVAPSTGFPGSRYVNAGEVRNRGAEMLLTALPVVRDNVNWEVTLNLSTNDSEILSLGGSPPIGTGDTQQREGYPPYGYFLKPVVSADLDEQGRAINVLCDGGPENNHEPMDCDAAPRVYWGKLEPDLHGAVSSGLTLFGRLQLHALFDFRSGSTKWAEDNWVRCSSYRICIENYEPERFSPERIAEIERASTTAMRTIYYNDADFVKLREISANYSFSSALAERFGAKEASVSVAGRNLYTWSDWTSLDPETSRLTSPGGIEQAQAPLMAQFVTTVHLTF